MPDYMYILLYMKLLQCRGIPVIYDQMKEGALVYKHTGIC